MNADEENHDTVNLSEILYDGEDTGQCTPVLDFVFQIREIRVNPRLNHNPRGFEYDIF